MDFKKFDVGKVKKISYWALLEFLLIILVFVLFPLLPIKNNYSLKMVTSGSMSPTIKTGAIVMVKPEADYQKGDIITFRVGKTAKDIVTHRIIDVKNGQFVTQGDANNVADTGSVRKSQILGKVVFSIPYAGYVANSVHSKLGFILLILIPALFIIFDQMKNIVGEVKKIRKKKLAN